MKLIFDGGTTETLRIDSDADLKLGDAPVAQKLELRMMKNVNEPGSPSFPVTTAEWGPLWLIHKYNGEREKADPKSWQIEFPVGAPGATGTIRLKIKFDRPLPERDKWPAQ
jgi:hypothetical protein